MKKFLSILAALGLTVFRVIATGGSAFAADDICGNPNVPQAVQDGAGCTPETAEELPNTLQNLVSVIIGILGAIALITLIFGAIQYMTAYGDSSKIKKGRDMLIYSIVGLVICILAFAIVNFVIGAF